MSDLKLADDCFRPGSQVMSHQAALALLRQRIRPLAGTERVALSEACGRVVAQSVVAGHPVPAYANSAVDGFGFASEGYAVGDDQAFALVGRAAAGHPFSGRVAPGQAVEILTGALVPDGVDIVAMQEDCRREMRAGRAVVLVPPGLKRGANIRLAGEDVAAGSELMAAGHTLRPQDMAGLASIGCDAVMCRKRLRVAIVATGDELVQVGTRPIAPGEVYDANTDMLASLVALAGAEPRRLGIWPDRRERVTDGLRTAAREVDVILTSGGASKGAEDHMAEAIASLGTRHVWEIAVKPGRPVMLGQIGDAVVIGLPGNPVAAFVCFLIYVFPMLRSLSGAPWPEPRRFKLPAAFTVAKRKLGRREFWRGHLVETPTGLAVEKFARDGSGLISGLRAADGLIECPEDREAVLPGEPVSFLPFSQFGILGR